MSLEKQTTDLKPLIDIYNSIFNFKEANKNEFRLEQVQYAVMCFEGVQHKKNVVIEGPTGLGKTRALFSAVLPKLLEDPETRVIYATRTTSQTTHVMKELKEILEGDEKFSEIDASVYTGVKNIKSKVCNSSNLLKEYKGFEKEKPCPDKCPLKNKKYDDLSKWELHTLVNQLNTRIGLLNSDDVPKEPLDLRILDQEKLLFLTNLTPKKEEKEEEEDSAKTPKKEIEGQCCPVSVMRSKGKSSRILVCTSELLLDTKWVEDIIGGEDEKSKTILILDEAHNFLESMSNDPYISFPDLDKNSNDDPRGNEGKRIEPSFSLRSLAQKTKRKWIDEETLPTLLKVRELADILKEELKKFETEENKLGNFRYIISEENMSDLVEALNDKIDLSQLYDSVKTIKENFDFDWGSRLDWPQVKQASSCLHSTLMILDYLENINARPDDFALVFDSEKANFYTLHPRNKAEKVINGFRNTILTSATLSPVKDVAYLLGLEDYLSAEIDPIFGKNDKNEEINKKKYISFFVSGINSSVKKDDKGNEERFTIKEKKVLDDLFLSALDAAKHKNIGIFCNSNGTLVEVYKQLKNLKSKLGLKILTYASQDSENKDLVEEVKKINDDYKGLCKIVNMDKKAIKNPNPENVAEVFKRMGEKKQTTVLLAAAGGLLSEGADYPGEAMEMVITVGLPYPSSATETKVNDIKSDYFLFQKGNKEYGEDLAFKQIAFRKLAQSIGRAHRKKTDEAVVICADERLMAIKNLKNEGLNRYEYLSMGNAKKNLKVIQERVREIDKNLVFSGYDKDEEHILKLYISSGFCKKDDFIDFDKMKEEIKKFYNG